jgi:NADH:ubiquinone oxidoreductase subunit 3 (subunit A)
MLVSISFLQKALKNRNKVKQKENYNSFDSLNAGMNLGFATTFLIIAFIFVFLELLVLVYSIILAVNCTKPGPERIIHIVLAITFTLPYVLFSVFFSKCSNNILPTN